LSRRGTSLGLSQRVLGTECWRKAEKGFFALGRAGQMDRSSSEEKLLAIVQNVLAIMHSL
jgi:hypothetical protein